MTPFKIITAQFSKKLLGHIKPKQMTTLYLQNLIKKYGGRQVVNSVSLDVKSGDVVGLLGPNGAGKTTTFYMTVGMLKPDGGNVLLDDEDITDYPMHIRSRKGVGYLPQDTSIFRKLSVKQNIMAILEILPISDSKREKDGLKLHDHLPQILHLFSWTNRLPELTPWRSTILKI
jgi:ABC-type lipopolysaccharide export system ATPase subunit